MSTPLTDSINALTAYCNEVDGGTDTNLSDAVYTLASGYGSGAEVATGTFTGDGTASSVNLNTGFKPDIVTVTSDLDYRINGWYGTGAVAIIKNVMTVNLRHNNTSATTAQCNANYLIGGDYPEYGDTSLDYCAYGTYSNGTFTVSNVRDNTATRFVADTTYTWTAIKYTA